MSKKILKCPVEGCSYESPATLDAFEVLTPFNMPAEEMKRKPPFGVEARNFRLDCPHHGPKIVQLFGNHVTLIPKKSSKKKL
jgi:hypothetical protein